MGYYKDIREIIKALEEHDKLVRVRREINKDTELMPLVRWQFRGLPEKQRKAFLFENIVDVKAKKFNGTVLVGAHGASTEIYALGMMCRPEEIMEKWAWAQSHPIKPEMVAKGVCQEEVHVGNGLLEHGGLMEFPVPISTPGFDAAPFFSASNWVTKDAETGIRNVGNYRAMVKSPTRTGINCVFPQHIYQHWDKCRQKGIPLQAAIVVGVSPSIGYVSITKVPYGVDEYEIAGGIGGEPIELVKCKTVDIEVPATAEIVIEGELPTDFIEREGPFGEHTGYIHSHGRRPYFNVTCITHRKNPVYTAFISQFPPSESSKIRQISDNAVLYHFLKYTRGIEGIRDVCWHEESGSWQFAVISLKKAFPPQAWQALKGADALDPQRGKIIIAVDEDIDARDPDSVIWALCYRMQPHRDILVTMGKSASLDPSAAPPGAEVPPGYQGVDLPTSSILIDATRKWNYPPIALPAKEFMEKAKKIWEELALPKLSPKIPWYGRSLGNWLKKFEEEAGLAVKGEYLETGERIAKEERISS
jgi:UbiD family decarboxylase